MILPLMRLKNSIILHKLTLNMNTLISMGSTDIGQLLPIVLHSKKCFLMHWNISDIVDDIIDTLRPDNVRNTYVAHLSNVTPASPKFELLRPLFGWTPADTIKHTFEVTTQYARGRVSDTTKQHWRSRFPACNVKRCNKPVATDTVFSDTPAVESGVTCAQLFVGRESLVDYVYGLKT
jgi:hypothetical protein